MATCATVVVTQRVRVGRRAEFRRWQDQVDAAAAGFAGFLGAEVTAPADTEPESDAQWSVVYRFDDTDHLRGWLGSATRRALLARGADLLAAPPTQHVLAAAPDDDVATVVVTHPYLPGAEAEFLAWQRRVVEAEAKFPGFRGSRLHRPVPGIQDSWTTVVSFDTAAHLDGWLGSPDRAALLAERRDRRDFEVQRIVDPYGSWFPAAGPGAVATASWKTALSVLVGLYPTVVVLTVALTELWPDAALWFTLLVGNVASVALLTWVVMPVVTRALGFWLEPADHRDRRRDTLGLVVSLAFLAAAAVVFWLVTTVLWTLP
ncbi:antibiotic biosynthesis monooxygenase [Rhodococcus kronopolitis]|uniref:Antibiotic biosynthesis monooxygenase n=1 Tax=Rhodococcus kronopolitis TaxID=1460226 RepID=A0ABV9FQV5_9NOCA